MRFVAGWHMVKFSWRLSTPEIHTVVVFLCDLVSSKNVKCFPALYFITFKALAVANCDAQ